MDFSRLPDHAFLNIFNYLPLEKRIRIGRVNKTFRRISQYVTSQTTSLDLTENRFRKMKDYQWTVVFNLCSPNLKVIKFPSLRGIQMATILANYQCPQLSSIDLDDIPIDYAVFDRLIRNNMNIENLTWSAGFVGFPNMTSNSLKKLCLTINRNARLQTLIDRCPNLNVFEVTTNNVSTNILDEFFASTQQIQKVNLCLGDNQIVLEDVVYFWNLPLTSLNVVFDGGKIAKGDILQKVATSFPRLQTLDMDLSDTTNQDIASLAVLQELEEFELVSTPIIDFHDDGIQELVACKKLRKLVFFSSIINSATLIALFRGCPQLKHVTICSIDDMETPEEGAVFLGSLSGITQRDIAIEFRPYDAEIHEDLKFIWESEAVKVAIANLEQEGLKVKIQWYNADLDEEVEDE